MSLATSSLVCPSLTRRVGMCVPRLRVGLGCVSLAYASGWDNRNLWSRE
jgi:hypothetical protein